MTLIRVDKEECTYCNACISECPAGLIVTDPGEGIPVSISNAEAYCISCGHCVVVCPQEALNLNWLKPSECLDLNSELVISEEQAKQFLLSRRSIRSFKEERVERTKLEKLVEIACNAPSAKNEQPWHWLVVEDPVEVKRLAGMVIDWMREFIKMKPEQAVSLNLPLVVEAWDSGEERICRGAPHLIVVCADKNWPFGAEDSASALTYLSLFAPTLGLGTCWGGYLYTAANIYEPLFKALEISKNQRVCGAMMVGHPEYEYYRLPLRNRPKVAWK